MQKKKVLFLIVAIIIIIVIAMPQAKSGFGAYKETKTWELNKYIA